MVLRLVKNKTLRKDFSKKRQDLADSPLRFPTNIYWMDTHERRIEWLYFENYQICREYLTAQLFYAILKLRLKRKQQMYVNLKEFLALKQAFRLWEEVNCLGDKYHDDWTSAFDNSFKYHYAGDEEE